MILIYIIILVAADVRQSVMTKQLGSNSNSCGQKGIPPVEHYFPALPLSTAVQNVLPNGAAVGPGWDGTPSGTSGVGDLQREWRTGGKAHLFCLWKFTTGSSPVCEYSIVVCKRKYQQYLFEEWWFLLSDETVCCKAQNSSCDKI